MNIDEDTINMILKSLDEKSATSIYLREIALLMEENENLKEQIDKLKGEK
tara:strand:- start:260 stop:409 length:150 start_codon:yes stop_codon:yes gene_type:complete